jgi:hypothetical protein
MQTKNLYLMILAMVSSSLFLASCDTAIEVPPTQQSVWQTVGNDLTFSAGVANFQTMIIDSNGVPYVGFSDNAIGNDSAASPAYHASVMQYQNNGLWGYTGSSDIYPAGKAFYEALVLDSNNMPILAFSDKANAYKTTVINFVNNVWTVVGSPAFSASAAYYQALAINSTGQITVADVEGTANSSSTFVKNNTGGTAWNILGGTEISNTSHPSVAFNTEDMLYVAVQNTSNEIQVFTPGDTYSAVAAPALDIWRIVGQDSAISANDQIASHPNLALNKSNGIMYIAFVESDHIVVKQFDTANNKWVAVGDNIVLANNNQQLVPLYPKLAIDNDIIYLAYQDPNDFNIKVVSFDAVSSIWHLLDTAQVGIPTGNKAYVLDTADAPVGANGSNADGGFALAISPDHTPYIAFKDNLNSGKTTVVRLITE